MRLALALAAGFLAAVGSASAYVRSGGVVMPHGHHRLKVGSVLDGFGAPTAAYGFRLLRSAYLGTGAAVRIRRASDNAESDVGFSGSGAWDNATAAAHCAATTCFVRTWYDQSGAARDLQQAAAAAQPQVIFGCQNGMACLQVSGASVLLQSGASVAVAGGKYSAAGVADRTAGTDFCIILQYGSPLNYFGVSVAAPAQWIIGSSTWLIVNAADAAWHAAAGVSNGVSSALRVDGGEVTGTADAAASGSGPIGVNSRAATTCRFAEGVLWDNYALSVNERAALVANQRAFWGF